MTGWRCLGGALVENGMPPHDDMPPHMPYMGRVLRESRLIRIQNRSSIRKRSISRGMQPDTKPTNLREQR